MVVQLQLLSKFFLGPLSFPLIDHLTSCRFYFKAWWCRACETSLPSLFLFIPFWRHTSFCLSNSIVFLLVWSYYFFFFFLFLFYSIPFFKHPPLVLQWLLLVNAILYSLSYLTTSSFSSFRLSILCLHILMESFTGLLYPLMTILWPPDKTSVTKKPTKKG